MNLKLVHLLELQTVCLISTKIFTPCNSLKVFFFIWCNELNKYVRGFNSVLEFKIIITEFTKIMQVNTIHRPHEGQQVKRDGMGEIRSM